MNKVRFLSALMALCMVISSVAVTAYAATDTNSSTTEAEKDSAAKNGEKDEDIIDYIYTNFSTKEQKLESMELKLENRFGYNMYVDSYTGEIAVQNAATGQTLFTNPYDVASSQASENVKTQLLSQIILKYSDGTTETEMYSYVEAAQRGQVVVKNIKNGLRVEYALGRTEIRKLVPRIIEKTRMEEQILTYFSMGTDEQRFMYQRMTSFYTLYDPNKEGISQRELNEMYSQYPITKQMAIYVLDTEITEKYLNLLESYIKLYCPHYTYEQLENDHQLVNYTGSEESPPLFRMALEYTLDENGLSVRLPANGIRFDASTYTLTYVKILPYFGAGAIENNGYTVIPDGSGSLVRFEDIAMQKSARTISGTLYGADYAYHTISGANQQVMRMPIFGLVEDYDQTVTVREKKSDEQLKAEGITVSANTETTASSTSGSGTASTAEDDSLLYNVYSKYVKEKRGFLAIIEEGDALASIVTDHGGGVLHKYNSIYAQVTPRPSDTYNLASSVSVGEDTTWTVVSERKYTGNYTIRYVMLTDDTLASEAGVDDYYECSYIGMAKAYQDYLVKEGLISRIDDAKEDIPLYIETLGVMDSADTFLTIPVTVKTELTTFDDLKAIYNDLSEQGITNIDFKLTGYTNGGLNPTIPYKVKFEGSVGGKSGYKEFISYAEEKGFGVYPEFEFSYIGKEGAFDGFSYRSGAIKTIDNRYTQKRTYSPVTQNFKNTGMVGISPSIFLDIFSSFKKNMDKIGLIGISVGSLGSDLNSDFNKSDPHNREDCKGYVVNTLETIKDSYGSIMIDGGNAYAIRYADHILNASLDSSRYTYASESIPLFGMVYHGYLNYAGSPTNKASDVEYETLKIIENGANPYFVFAYRNSEKLKEDKTGLASQYYSVAYDIWRDDLIEIYNELNGVLADLQEQTIVDHEILIGERVPSDEEAQADALEAKLLAEQKQAYAEALAAEQERANKLEDLRAASEGRAPQYTEVTSVPGMSAPGSTVTIGDEEVDRTKDPNYTYTKYTSDNGMIVRVTYSDGTQFILNYNTFAVTVDGYTLDARGFVKISK